MNDGKLEIEVKPVLDMFADLSYGKQKGVYKRALRKSCNILAKEARNQLKREIGKAASHKSLKYGKRLTQGVRVSVAKDGLSAKVHIMGDKRKGDFRLKWFELGTDIRMTRKTHANRGQMRATYFFKKARLIKEKEAASTLEENIKNEIIKINDKHK